MNPSNSEEGSSTGVKRVLNDVSETFFQPYAISPSIHLTTVSRKVHLASFQQGEKDSAPSSSARTTSQTSEYPHHIAPLCNVSVRNFANSSETRPLLTDYQSINDPNLRLRVPSTFLLVPSDMQRRRQPPSRSRPRSGSLTSVPTLRTCLWDSCYPLLHRVFFSVPRTLQLVGSHWHMPSCKYSPPSLCSASIGCELP